MKARSLTRILAIFTLLQTALLKQLDSLNPLDSNFSFYLAPNEVLVKGVGDFFKSVNDKTYQYSTSSPGLKLTRMIEQRFGDMPNNLACSRVIFMENITDPRSMATYSTFGALCNSSIILLFNFSTDFYSISSYQLIDGKGSSCLGIHFQPTSRSLAVTCFSEDSKNVALTVYKPSGFIQATTVIKNSAFRQNPQVFQVPVTPDTDIVFVYDKDLRWSPSQGDQGLAVAIVQRINRTFEAEASIKYFPPAKYSAINSMEASVYPNESISISMAYLDPTNVIGAEAYPLINNGTAWILDASQAIGGVSTRMLGDHSKILFNTSHYFEYDDSKKLVTQCSLKDNSIDEKSCISIKRTIGIIYLMTVKDIKFTSQGVAVDFKYSSSVFNSNNTISTLMVYPASADSLDFEQIIDKFGQYSSSLDNSLFFCKGTKYSFYSPTDADEKTLVLVSANEVKVNTTIYFIDQEPVDGGPSNRVIIMVSLTEKLTTDYGFLDDFPDFAGYINMPADTSFNRDFMYGNNLELKLMSNSTQDCKVSHLQTPSYQFPDSVTPDSSDLYFANATHGVVSLRQTFNSSAFRSCMFACVQDSDPRAAHESFKCVVEDIPSKCRSDNVKPSVAGIVPISQNSIKGVLLLTQTQKSAILTYFPSVGESISSVTTPPAFNDSVVNDIIFYELNYDGYLAVTYLTYPAVSIYVLPQLTLDLEEFFTITAGSASIPPTYFCPTKIDVCPDNPSVLDVLSSCPQDLRVLKFIMEPSTRTYNLYDMNTLNHPFIPPPLPDEQSDISFCAMGKEFIVSATVAGNTIVYGRTTEREGVHSFHTFNFRDFGFDQVTKVHCLNSMRGFAIEGMNNRGSTNFGVAVLFGNEQGFINKKYAKVKFLNKSNLKNIFSVSNSDVLAYYSNDSLAFNFLHLNMYGPYIQIQFTDDAKFDSQLTLVIDRSEYNLPNIERTLQVNLMPFKNHTKVQPKKLHAVQKANYSLDEMFVFDGHVLSASILKNGVASPDVIVNPRLASFFSPFSVHPSDEDSEVHTARQLQEVHNFQDQTSSDKFNRLFDLGDKLVGLTNDTSHSYLVFYKDYYTQSDTPRIQITDAICQNMDVAIAADFYFIVLKCNNYNVYSVVWVVVPQTDSSNVIPLVKRFITDDIDSVTIGKQGDSYFLIATNLLTGIRMTVVGVKLVNNRYYTEYEQNITLSSYGSLFSYSHQHRVHPSEQLLCPPDGQQQLLRAASLHREGSGQFRGNRLPATLQFHY